MRRPQSRRLASALLGLALIGGLLSVVALPPTPAEAAMELGQVAIISSDDPQCDNLVDATCQKFRVTCPDLAVAEDGWYSVQEEIGSYRGVIVFFSGGGGNFYWSGEKEDGTDGALHIVQQLREDGFRILQVRWGDAWEDAAPGEHAGSAVACRPASIIDFLEQEEYDPPLVPPANGVCGFCVAGASGGSSQIAYALSHFGLDSILDGVFPISGPTHAAIKKGCAPQREWVQYRYQGPSTKRLDGPFGYVADNGAFAQSNGPCARRSNDPGWHSEWDALSIDTGGDDYQYPNTRLHLVMGSEDRILRAHAGDYLRRLAEGGPATGQTDASPWVTYELVPGMGHGISIFPEKDGTSLEEFPGLVRLYQAIVNTDPATFAACGNGRDDDGDGQGDFAGVPDEDPTVPGNQPLAADPGCANAADASENTDPTQVGSVVCDDGLDNDGDGRFDASGDDFGDPGCDNTLDTDEHGPNDGSLPCDDGIDNDGEGLIDFPADPGCSAPGDLEPLGNAEKELGRECDDGIDNDGDTKTDFALVDGDPDCASASSPSETATVNIGDTSPLANVESEAMVSFPVSITSEPASTVTVSWTTASGTAAAGPDFDANSGQVTFEPLGVLTKDVHVDLNQDQLDEPEETFFVDLALVSGPATIGDGRGESRIQDDDEEPTLSIAGGSVIEGQSGTRTLRFVVTLSKASGKQVSASFATANGSATLADNDYESKSGTVSFPPGTALTRNVDVVVNGDTAIEPDENFSVTLSGPVNASFAGSTTTGTITNDDSLAVSSLSIADSSRLEGQGGTRNLTFVVTLNPASAANVTVDYATRNDTAISGSDYQGKQGSVTFTPGVTQRTINITLNGDTVFEPDETFFVDLSDPSANATISRGTAIGKIENDDASSGGDVTISIKDASIAEGDAGTVALKFKVTLSRSSTQRITVRLTTGGGNARAGTDYQSKSVVLTFEAGQTSKTVSVMVIGDTQNEPNETFNVTLSQPTNATIADGTGVMTIQDDE